MVPGLLLFEPHAAVQNVHNVQNVQNVQDVQDALARGATLANLLSPERPVALYGAALAGDTWALGRYQHEGQLLPAPRPWLRRASGGATIRLGDGVVYAALALLERSSLLACPPGRLLNRNVRGVLTGLRNVGLRLNYFGRDFLSCDAQPVIYVAWDMREDGRVLLEFFIAHHSPWFVPDSELSYPPRSEPALRGRTPTTTAQAQPGLGPAELLRAIADGHARAFGVAWSDESARAGSLLPVSPDALAATQMRTGADPRLVFSAPREEAIGFVSAGVALDACGKFAATQLVGDFFAQRACTADLEARLRGTLPTSRAVGEAVDATFTRAGYDVEGIRSLGVFRDAILDATESYTQAHANTSSGDRVERPTLP